MRSRTKAILLLLVLSAGTAGWWFHSRYLVLSIPVLRHAGGGDFWWETQFSELAYADSPGVLYLHRQVGTAYIDRQGWRTIDDAFSYFHHWLTERGWQRREIYTGGDPVMPESRHLDPSRFREYCRPGDDWGRSDRVALAVWPIGGSVQGFHVAIVTARPSLRRSIHDAFND